MCGIAGIISRDLSKVDRDVLQSMAECLAHRGPDGQAVWVSNDGVAGLAHRRLCVIDLSEDAAQPMHYLDRYTIIYNGEIYNYREVRESLAAKGYYFKTASDTEVILAAYAEYKEDCLQHFDGMFALALWDNKEKQLFCARDRFGEKPFYYTSGEAFVFGSEIKALRAAGIEPAVDNGMLLQYLTAGTSSDPSDASRSFYKNIRSLPAAHRLIYNAHENQIKIERYWQVERGITAIAADEAIERCEEMLTTSVTRRLRSDVSLGCSVSGGLDSSGIVALLADAGGSGLNTFTAAFPGFERDESRKARFVADQFGFHNYTTRPSGEELVGDFQKLAWHHDEPVSSASVYAQYKVFELASQHDVVVLLDGQGADEVFGGYDHYRTWGIRALFPRATQRALEYRQRRRVIANRYIDRAFISEAIQQLCIDKPLVRNLNDWLHFDTFNMGLEQLLRYADRNSMAHGREVRLPYLFHELVEFVFSLPSAYKIRHGYTKWVLRKLMQRRLPEPIVWTQRKIGFEPPQKAWMESPAMKQYIIEAKKRLVQDGILSKIVLDQRSSSHDAYARQAFEWRWMAASAFLHG